MAKGRRKGSENQVGKRDIGFGSGVVPSSEMIGDLNLRDDLTLADKINMTNGRGRQRLFSGRGHGRKTHHGRGPTRGSAGPRSKKRDMLYFVRDTVRTWRTMSMVYSGPVFSSDGGGMMKSSFEWANVLVNDMQFFDCSEIYGYVDDNVIEMYHDDEVPPHPDAILPASAVGLYLPNYCPPVSAFPPETEAMLLCLPMVGAEETRDAYTIYTVLRGEDGDIMRGPLGFGNIDIPRGTFGIHQFSSHSAKPTPEELDGANRTMRLACGLLQTINQPRFVVQAKRDVSLVKRQSFKKAAGKFTPDSWNMVTWNVDKAVKAKSYDEGSGGRQALHFRRGHWRKAEEGWERSRWSESRGRWEQYIHGYEAGHPAFGVKKSYHLPRKEPV